MRRVVKRSRKRQEGQALVESALGMFLAAFVLILVIIISHQTLNRNRTLVAARHAAWMAGNDRRDNNVDLNGFGEPLAYVNNINLWNWFFNPGTDLHTQPVHTLQSNFNDAGAMNPGNLLVRVVPAPEAGGSTDFGIANGEVSGGDVDVGELTDNAAYIFPYRVIYGTTDLDSDLTQTWPWPLMKLDPPFMEETVMREFLVFDSVVKWDEVVDPWKEADNAFSDIAS